MTKANPFTYEVIGNRTLKVKTDETGKWYWHESCRMWFPEFSQCNHGGDIAGAWLLHHCEGITPATLLHPDWAALADAVRAQSERLAAGK